MENFVELMSKEEKEDMYKCIIHLNPSSDIETKTTAFERLMLIAGVDIYGTPKEFIESYLTDPASAKYHGNYEGGLVYHSSLVTKKLLDYTADGLCTFERMGSPIIIGMLHDICKVGSYSRPWDKYEKVDDIWSGHATKSLALISTGLFREFHLTEQEALCIRYHMGAYETDEWKEFGRAVQKYPEVLYTHTADMYVSHYLGI